MCERGIVQMEMAAGMIVLVAVEGTVSVNMEMSMRFVADHLAQAPGEVNQTERHEEPSRQISPDRFDVLQVEDGHPYGDSDRTEQQRAKHVSNSADPRHKKGLA